MQLQYTKTEENAYFSLGVLFSLFRRHHNVNFHELFPPTGVWLSIIKNTYFTTCWSLWMFIKTYSGCTVSYLHLFLSVSFSLSLSLYIVRGMLDGLNYENTFYRDNNTFTPNGFIFCYGRNWFAHLAIYRKHAEGSLYLSC